MRAGLSLGDRIRRHDRAGRSGREPMTFRPADENAGPAVGVAEQASASGMWRGFVVSCVRRGSVRPIGGARPATQTGGGMTDHRLFVSHQAFVVGPGRFETADAFFAAPLVSLRN